MRKLFPFLFLLLPSLAYGGAKLIDPTNMPHGDVLPATCSQGNFFMKTSATSGQQIYMCESANTWVLEGGGPFINGTSSGTLSMGGHDFVNVATITVTQIGISTNAVGTEKINEYVADGGTSHRLALDGSDGTFGNFTILDLFTNYEVAPTFVRNGQIKVATVAGAPTINVTNADGTTTHSYDLQKGAYSPGIALTGQNDVQGNSINFKSSLGAASFSVQGSTVISKPNQPHIADNGWLYFIDASTANANVYLELTSASSGFENGRMHRVCKADNSAHTVTVGGPTMYNPVTLSNVYECVEFYDMSSNGSGDGHWIPIGVMTSTSTPAAGDNLGNHIATQDLNLSSHSVVNCSTMSFTNSLINGVTTYWSQPPLPSDTVPRLLELTSGGMSYPVAVTDGVETGGVTGSTTTMTSRIDMSEMKLPTGTTPTVGVLGEIGFDTTDNIVIANNGTEQFLVGEATQTLNVTILAGSSWDSQTVPILTAPADKAISIRSIESEIIGGTSLAWNIDTRAFGSANTAGTSIFTLAQSASQAGITSLTNGTIAAGSTLYLKTGTGAASGTVNALHLIVAYTENVE